MSDNSRLGQGQQFDFVEEGEPMETQATYIVGRDVGDEARPGGLSLILPAPTDGALPLVSVTIDGTPVPAERRATREGIRAEATAWRARAEAAEAQLELALTEQTLMRADFYTIQDQERAAYQEYIAAEYHARRMAEIRVAALEEALRPLAALADHVDRQGFADEQTLWTYGVWGDPMAYRALAAGHARAARRALDGQEVRTDG